MVTKRNRVVAPLVVGERLKVSTHNGGTFTGAVAQVHPATVAIRPDSAAVREFLGGPDATYVLGSAHWATHLTPLPVIGNGAIDEAPKERAAVGGGQVSEQTTVTGLGGATAGVYRSKAPIPPSYTDLIVHSGGTAGIVMPVPALAQLTTLLTNALRDRRDQLGLATVAGVLTSEQNAAITYFRALNVQASWFVGEPHADGTIEVIALGDTFVWAFRIAPDGQFSSSEAEVGEFSTGITC